MFLLRTRLCDDSVLWPKSVKPPTGVTFPEDGLEHPESTDWPRNTAKSRTRTRMSQLFFVCLSLSLSVSLSLKLPLRLRSPFRSFLLLPYSFLPSFLPSFGARLALISFRLGEDGDITFGKATLLTMPGRYILLAWGLPNSRLSVSSWSKLTRRVQNLKALSRDAYPSFLNQHSMRRSGGK